MVLHGTELHWGDILVIAAYFVIVIVVGIWSSYRSKRGSVSEYFLAGRHTHWILVGSSMYAANIGSDHFIGLAGSGAKGGIAVAGYELNALFTILMLGWLFAPVYIASGVFTMPEYLRKRFGGQRIRVYLSVLSLVLCMLTKISADLFSGTLFIQQALHWNVYISTCVILFLASIFTVAGGLHAVMSVDIIQVIIMIGGAFVLMAKSFVAVGGYHGLIEKYLALAVPEGGDASHHGNETCNRPPADGMHLLRHHSNPEYPWIGMTFGLTISATWYLCTDQVMVQRLLASKNFTNAKAGCVLYGFLKILPLWLLVFPGMAARVLFPGTVGCNDTSVCYETCGSTQGCSNIAYPELVIRLMPDGLRGLMLAVMLASLMGSLTCIFNSASTLFTIDIWLRMRRRASTTEQLVVGKLFVVVMVVVSVLWIPVINEFPGSELFGYIQSITAYLAPPICAVFVWAVFVPRVNEPGAFYGLMVGLVVGMIRFIVELSYKAPPCGGVDSRPAIITKVHYLHFGILLFGISSLVILTVSFLTKPIDQKHLWRLTFWTRHSKEHREDLSAGDHTDYDKQVSATFSSKGTLRLSSLNPESAVVPPFPETKEDKPPPSLCKRFLYRLCGLSLDTVTDATMIVQQAEEQRRHDEKATSLVEKLHWRILCDASAVVLFAAGVFVWVYWG